MIDLNILNDINTYDYDLPVELIAKEPIFPKESAKLLVYERLSKNIYHKFFGDLVDLIPKNTSIIFNDTKVIKARLFGKKNTGGMVEVMLNQPLGSGKWSVFIRGRVRIGSKIIFSINPFSKIVANVIDIIDDGSRVVVFSKDDAILDDCDLLNIVDVIGHIPLPPYIKRTDMKEDENWYQSIFAREKGAVAAPTASLHFSDELLQKLRDKFDIYYLTLHVGAGTFKGVEKPNIQDHVMHSERYNIPDKTIKLIESDKPILGIGTTVTRVVENYIRNNQKFGECRLFLNPLNPPKRQNYLLTNFHLPKSTLIMLVASFIGIEATQKIYAEAIKNKYRFYSYGDGMLII